MYHRVTTDAPEQYDTTPADFDQQMAALVASGITVKSYGDALNEVYNPVPTITTISPSSTTAPGATFTLTINGTGFNSSSVVNWNGAGRTTNYVSSTQLTAPITAADVAAAGTASVFNPAPGGGTSAAATFTIKSPGSGICGQGSGGGAAVLGLTMGLLSLAGSWRKGKRRHLPR